MRPAKYLVFFILCCILLQDVCAQHTSKVPAGISNLFDDLPIDDPAANSVLHPGEDSLQKISRNIFVRSSLSSLQCFIGEPVLVTYELYSALQSTSKINHAPAMAGFSLFQMDEANEAVKRKKQGGKNYRVFSLQRSILTPLQEGVLTIEPMIVYNEINYKENGKNFHYGGAVESKPMLVNVQPLPAEGRPSPFSGAVGSFIISVIADTVIAAGENNTLHVEIGGTGNFVSLSMPALVWPPGTAYFSVNTREEINKDTFPQQGKKIFDIPFVAKTQGELVIPATAFNFFDPAKKKYQVVYSAPLHIQVTAPLHAVQSPKQLPAPVEKRLSWIYWLIAVGVIAITFMIFHIAKNKKPGTVQQTMPEPVSLLPDPVNTREKLKALQDAKDTHTYITGFKQALLELLKSNLNMPDAAEETLVHTLGIKDADSAVHAKQLFEQCNVHLYAPGKLDIIVQEKMESSLMRLDEKINTFSNHP